MENKPHNKYLPELSGLQTLIVKGLEHIIKRNYLQWACFKTLTF